MTVVGESGPDGAAMPSPPRSRPSWLVEADRLDVAIYAAIAATPTPTLDKAMGRLTRSADYSGLWVGAAALLAAGRGEAGRRGAAMGLASLAVGAAVVNLGLKPLGGRRRPDPAAFGVPIARRVEMPTSTSFPSGHAASSFAFAVGVGHVLPREALPLRALAALVAYSRVHTGVHYAGDVVAGSLAGSALAQATTHVLHRRLTA